jgi:hypothetical protein
MFLTSLAEREAGELRVKRFYPAPYFFGFDRILASKHEK